VALDRFLRGSEELKRAKTYLASQTAFEKKCRECPFLIRAEEVEAGIFKWRVFCGSEECAKSSR